MRLLTLILLTTTSHLSLAVNPPSCDPEPNPYYPPFIFESQAYLDPRDVPPRSSFLTENLATFLSLLSEKEYFFVISHQLGLRKTTQLYNDQLAWEAGRAVIPGPFIAQLEFYEFVTKHQLQCARTPEELLNLLVRIDEVRPLDRNQVPVLGDLYYEEDAFGGERDPDESVEVIVSYLTDFQRDDSGGNYEASEEFSPILPNPAVVVQDAGQSSEDSLDTEQDIVNAIGDSDQNIVQDLADSRLNVSPRGPRPSERFSGSPSEQPQYYGAMQYTNWLRASEIRAHVGVIIAQAEQLLASVGDEIGPPFIELATQDIISWARFDRSVAILLGQIERMGQDQRFREFVWTEEEMAEYIG
ncbi:hypothetical protein Dda_7207 [Drechslerella dactyloides]|uniref:Uncharacterized protein n=1 Tax=Drechslerella dactyloides TaxID=74499 RepID=A0AAD6IX16_DREDA|nr:hypothetical protein Dda_7207 [Drechslerella dactyloides]